MPAPRPQERSRLAQSYHSAIVPIYPGQAIRTVIADAYPEYKAFRLLTGRHVLYGELELDLDGVVVYGDWSSEVILLTEDARVTLSGEGAGLVGCVLDHVDMKYSTDMVRVSGARCRVQDVNFRNANEGVGFWPLHILSGSNEGQFIGNVFKHPTTPSSQITFVFADDGAKYNLFTGNQLGFWTGGAMGRHLLSIRDANNNEAGQSVAGAGTSPSHANYCDVVAR